MEWHTWLILSVFMDIRVLLALTVANLVAWKFMLYSWLYTLCLIILLSFWRLLSVNKDFEKKSIYLNNLNLLFVGCKKIKSWFSQPSDKCQTRPMVILPLSRLQRLFTSFCNIQSAFLHYVLQRLPDINTTVHCLTLRTRAEDINSHRLMDSVVL